MLTDAIEKATDYTAVSRLVRSIKLVRRHHSIECREYPESAPCREYPANPAHRRDGCAALDPAEPSWRAAVDRSAPPDLEYLEYPSVSLPLRVLSSRTIVPVPALAQPCAHPLQIPPRSHRRESATPGIASHRIASHRIASHRIGWACRYSAVQCAARRSGDTGQVRTARLSRPNTRIQRSMQAQMTMCRLMQAAHRTAPQTTPTAFRVCAVVLFRIPPDPIQTLPADFIPLPPVQ